MDSGSRRSRLSIRRTALSLALALAALATNQCGTAKPAATAAVPRSVLTVRNDRSPPAVALAAPVPTTMSKHASLKLVSTWHTCHESFVVGGGDVRAEVARLAQGCAEATKMQRVGEPFTGEQSAAGKPQTFTWKAHRGHCYRVYGVGAPAIKNLDLLVLDSAGAALGQDGTDDGAPVVLDAGAACFTEDDDAALVVSVGDGEGHFAVEVWSD